MAKRKTWRSNLTKKERKHLSENGIRTKTVLIEQVAHIKKEMKRGIHGIVCWECIPIAKKVGVWEDTKEAD